MLRGRIEGAFLCSLGFIFTFRVDYENIKNDEEKLSLLFSLLSFCSQRHHLQITNSCRQIDVVLVRGP